MQKFGIMYAEWSDGDVQQPHYFFFSIVSFTLILFSILKNFLLVSIL
jgi:hypothetical protein